MVLDLLSIKTVAQFPKSHGIDFCKPGDRGGCERDALVGRAEEDVDVLFGRREGGEELDDSLSIGGGDGAEEVGAVEQACIEKVRGLTARFQGIGAVESEYGCGETGFEEFGFIVG